MGHRSKPNTPDKWYRNYDGIIALAVSEVKGKKGIGGPYNEKAIIMEPDTAEPNWTVWEWIFLSIPGRWEMVCLIWLLY